MKDDVQLEANFKKPMTLERRLLSYAVVFVAGFVVAVFLRHVAGSFADEPVKDQKSSTSQRESSELQKYADELDAINARYEKAIGETEDLRRELLRLTTMLKTKEPDSAPTRPEPVPKTREEDRKSKLIEPTDELKDYFAETEDAPTRHIKMMPFRPYRPYRPYKTYSSGDRHTVGSKEDCRRNRYTDECYGTYAHCERDADNPECEGTLFFCMKYSGHKSCVGTEQFCLKNRSHKQCSGTPAWCHDRKKDAICSGTLVFCEVNPGNSMCYGTKPWCNDIGGAVCP